MADFSLLHPGTLWDKSISGPVSQYVPAGTFLEASCWNSVPGTQLRIRARLLTMQGKSVLIEVDREATSDRLFNQFFFELPEGFLQSVRVGPAGGTAIRRGQCYTTVLLKFDSDPSSTAIVHLVRGYLVNREGVFWPGGQVENQVSGRGVMLAVFGTNPAAGVEILETVPINARWRLHAFGAPLVTNATVANRQAYLVITAPIVGEVTRFPFVGTTPASTSSNYRATHAGVAPVAVGSFLFAAMGRPVDLFQGWTVGTSTGALQAGDDWGPPTLFVEELIEE